MFFLIPKTIFMLYNILKKQNKKHNHPAILCIYLYMYYLQQKMIKAPHYTTPIYFGLICTRKIEV